MLEGLLVAYVEPVRRLHQILAQPEDVGFHLLVQHLLRDLM